jgi:iron complex outermembrane receptor protein
MPTAKYSRFPNAQIFLPLPTGANRTVSPADISGTRMIRAPKFTLNGGGAFNTDLAGGAFQAAVNASYNSGFFWQPGETARQRAYTLVNANVSWRTPDQRLKFTLYSENLTNKVYGIYEAQSAIGDSVAYGRPREVGVRADVNF